MVATPRIQVSIPSISPATPCPRCAAPKSTDLWLCDACYVREPFVCAICGQVDALADGLCATCAERDALILDVDPDAPIPYALTPQGEAALALPLADNILLDGECPTCGALGRVLYGGRRARCEYCAS